MQVKWRDSAASPSISFHSRLPPCAVQREITERKPPGANMRRCGPDPWITWWIRMPLMVANAMDSGWIFLGLHASRQAHRAEERVAERAVGRDRPSELRAVDEAEEREHRAGERPESRLLEAAVDDERGERAQHQPREHRAAAEKLHAVIDEPGACEL